MADRTRQELSNLISRLFQTLTTGQFTDCVNADCPLRGARLAANEAASTALLLASQPPSAHLACAVCCRPRPAPPTVPPPAASPTVPSVAAPAAGSLSLPRLRSLLDDAAAAVAGGGDVDEARRSVVRAVGTACSSPDAAAGSFADSDPPTPSSEGVDDMQLTGVCTAYRLLLDAPEAVRDAVLNALATAQCNLAKQLKAAAARSINRLRPPECRAALMLLVSPLVDQPGLHDELVVPLLAVLAHAAAPLAADLERFWRTLDTDSTVRLLHAHQAFVTLRVAASERPKLLLRHDQPVRDAVLVMAQMHAANVRRSEPISYAEFYHDLLSSELDLVDEFSAWKNLGMMQHSAAAAAGSNFSYLRFPWILTPFVKSRVLLVENVIQQRTERQGAMQNFMFGLVDSPYLVIRVSRETLIQDSLDQLMRYDRADLKKELKVHFEHEEAVDEGGPQKVPSPSISQHLPASPSISQHLPASPSLWAALRVLCT
eukprot:TRINITY_DN6322_c0_g1_i2.p1 TRINITY_DN6322_c0_g1~~TRINITY_DN6322_c0_g1_i2.p1  ORF type:complete len:487 (-),score=143.51 TRINITY_DN6322_c0_g1_i2:1208-2668(-)